ncbi:putative phage abortive infection protein [Lucifera butyrica]|uniref:Putative phage abortive infection protein n=1 Tax=Lucifera butyrica TaxID=1351585 RepID=A0A498REB4_9FIRM|nr:putative phage abortive infection protein [Lucifera butyrica]VBB09160.1 putative phage abortive infection protein [Lucifera butyrica]
MAQQKFEESFFSLLSMFRQHADKVRNDYLKASADIQDYITTHSMYPHEPVPFEKLIGGYYDLKKRLEGLDVYYKIITQLLLFVATSEAVDDETKKRFFALVETSMDSEELCLLFWDWFFAGKNNPMTIIVRKYKFLDDFLSHRQHIIPTQQRETFLNW